MKGRQLAELCEQYPDFEFRFRFTDGITKFPNIRDFTEKDIHVKQWQGGNHWYSFLGGMPVRVKVNGELKTKWNTRKAAKDAARAMLQNA